MDNQEICYMSIVDMAKAVKTRKLSPTEIMEAVLSRIERLNPKVNAYCTLVFDSARNQAKDAETKVLKKEKIGPLHGVPVSIKDLIFTKGIRTTGGSCIYRNFIPEQDAIVVERLKAAGAIIVGKTNTSEFGWKPVTENRLFGPTHNPWNLGFNTGGSSGGAAAAVAAGMGPLAMGSDAGGSIRIPSSCCGVFGLKPSFGRVPTAPGFPRWGTLNNYGPITRIVRDAAMVMEIIAGKDDRDWFSLPDTGLHYLPSLGTSLKGMKIAWSPDFNGAVLEPQVARKTEAAVKIINSLGAEVETATPRVESSTGGAFSTFVGSCLWAALRDKMEECREQMDQGLVHFLERNKDKLASEFVQASGELYDSWNGLQPFFEKYDLMLTPTTAVPSLPIGQPTAREINGLKVPPHGWVPFTHPFNITGQPAASIPCGWTDEGLPVGLQIIGRRFDDISVFKVAAAFEEALPWADKWPPLD